MTSQQDFANKWNGPSYLEPLDAKPFLRVARAPIRKLGASNWLDVDFLALLAQRAAAARVVSSPARARIKRATL